jgi:L-threonylcarbamoyladenylate synthase
MAKVIPIYNEDQEVIDKNILLANNVLTNNGIVAFKTETVYGLGGNAYSDTAISKIYKLKGRPANNPLIVHFCNKEDIKNDCYTNEVFDFLYKRFMPGALTLVLKKKESSRISKLCSKDYQAVRIPNEKSALTLIESCGFPIAAPSANISNHISPSCAEHVAMSFPEADLLILDGGNTNIGVESTVVNVSDPSNIQILRHGSITQEMLEDEGLFLNSYEDNSMNKLSPGLMKKHYSPNTPVSLDINSLLPGDILIRFGSISYNIPENVIIISLSDSGNLIEAAQNLYRVMWQADTLKCNKIVFMPIPNVGVGRAINDRLLKASAGN